mmetsp:Transcript_20896/g.40970  ORF Transcript_20896/g.40970 Transcript_20896/m.40970 type:complete len:131 (-) Transcript_20896:87-479(-)
MTNVVIVKMKAGKILVVLYAPGDGHYAFITDVITRKIDFSQILAAFERLCNCLNVFVTNILPRKFDVRSASVDGLDTFSLGHFVADHTLSKLAFTVYIDALFRRSQDERACCAGQELRRVLTPRDSQVVL